MNLPVIINLITFDTMNFKKIIFIAAGLMMMTALLSGIWTGLIRVGLDLPLKQGMTNHGAIFVCSFVSTLIFFKTIKDSGKKFLLVIPLLNVISIIPLLLNQTKPAFLLLTITSIGFTVFIFTQTKSISDIKSIAFLLGSLCLVVGNFKLFLTGFYPVAVPFWIGAVLLIIFAENINESIIRSRFRLLWFVLTVSITIAVFIPFHSSGELILGILLLVFSIVIPVTLFSEYKKLQLPLFFKSGFITSYFFLFLTGLIYVSGTYTGYHYDASVHSFFLGYLFVMIFTDIGSGRCLSNGNSEHKTYFINYFWIFLLSVSLLMRIYADFDMATSIRIFAAKFNGVAILGFFITHIIQKIRSRKMS